MDSLWPPTISANIWSVFLVLFLAGAFLQWICWIAGWGRFKSGRSQVDSNRNPIRHVVADLFVKVIDDFRHLLALIIVVMFAATLIYGLYIGGDNVDNLAKALQAVTGSLSGVIGVIIGYYFGESAARKRDDDTPPGEAEQGANEQQPVSGEGEDVGIQPAPQPPRKPDPQSDESTDDG